MGKYDSLARYLGNVSGSSAELAFEQIANLVPGALPPSAYRYPAWWANESSGPHVQARAWMSAGWRVQRCELGRRRVTFVRTEGQRRR